jgi:hypothetical protein
VHVSTAQSEAGPASRVQGHEVPGLSAALCHKRLQHCQVSSDFSSHAPWPLAAPPPTPHRCALIPPLPPPHTQAVQPPLVWPASWPGQQWHPPTATQQQRQQQRLQAATPLLPGQRGWLRTHRQQHRRSVCRASFAGLSVAPGLSVACACGGREMLLDMAHCLCSALLCYALPCCATPKSKRMKKAELCAVLCHAVLRCLPASPTYKQTLMLLKQHKRRVWQQHGNVPSSNPPTAAAAAARQQHQQQCLPWCSYVISWTRPSWRHARPASGGR